MHICCFCGKEIINGASRLCLCADCRAQISRLSAASPRYQWYLTAVRRALFTA